MDEEQFSEDDEKTKLRKGRKVIDATADEKLPKVDDREGRELVQLM